MMIAGHRPTDDSCLLARLTAEAHWRLPATRKVARLATAALHVCIGSGLFDAEGRRTLEAARATLAPYAGAPDDHETQRGVHSVT